MAGSKLAAPALSNRAAAGSRSDGGSIAPTWNLVGGRVRQLDFTSLSHHRRVLAENLAGDIRRA